MPHLDPTYLRYIYDNLIKGSVHPDNASELPDGLIGLYEEAFEEHLPLQQRQKLLKRFAIWALLMKEVSAAFVAEVLGETEEDIQEFISTYSAWFTSPESGKYQLYHERFRIYVLQKVTEKDITQLNNKFIAFCETTLNTITKNEIPEKESYALEFLSNHHMIHYSLTSENDKLMTLVQDRSYWNRQILISGSQFWTLKSLRHGINSALLSNKNEHVIINTINYLSVELDLLNDLDSIIKHLENGEYSFSEQKLNYLKDKNSKKIELTLNYLLIYSDGFSSHDAKIVFLRGIEFYIKNCEIDYSFKLLPHLFAFDLANFCFLNDIDYKFIFSNDKIDITRDRAFENKPLIIDFSKYEKFIYHLLSENNASLSNKLIDSILYTALKEDNFPLIELLLKTDFSKFSITTAEYLALYFFYEKKPNDFLRVIKTKDDNIHMLYTLTMRLLIKEKFEKITQFISEIPDIFYQIIVYAQMAQAALFLDKKLIFDEIFFLLKNEKLFLKEDIADIISMLELKEYIFNHPEEANRFLNSDTTIINQVLSVLGFNEQALQFYRNSKIGLYDLNNLNINKISQLLGATGAIEEFMSEKRKELKRTSNSLFFGDYNWEDESVLWFIIGMGEVNFKNKFLEIYNFLKGPENLGALYKLDPIRTKFRFLFYIYHQLKQRKEDNKALIVRNIIVSEFSKVDINDLNVEVTSRYFDLCFFENNLLKVADETIKLKLIDSKIPWDSDYHLAKIAEEFLQCGDGKLGYILLSASHPSCWNIDPISASIKWHKLTKSFLNYFIKIRDFEKCIDLVTRSSDKFALEMLHEISMDLTIMDEDLKERISTLMRNILNNLNVEHFDRITRENKHKSYFSGLILEAELLHNLFGYEKSRTTYAYICDNLSEIKNHDDLQFILNKLCQSLVKNKCVEFYSHITNNLHVIDTVVVRFSVKGWKKPLLLFRNELNNIGDFDSLKIVDSKISLLPSEENFTNDKLDSKMKQRPVSYYLSPFESYKMSLYSATSSEMLNIIIRYASNQCFSHIMEKQNDIAILSDVLGLKKWMILGFEIHLNSKR